MDRNYNFTTGQRISSHDEDGGNIYGSITDTSRDTVFIRWDGTRESQEYERTAFDTFKLTNRPAPELNKVPAPWHIGRLEAQYSRASNTWRMPIKDNTGHIIHYIHGTEKDTAEAAARIVAAAPELLAILLKIFRGPRGGGLDVNNIISIHEAIDKALPGYLLDDGSED